MVKQLVLLLCSLLCSLLPVALARNFVPFIKGSEATTIDQYPHQLSLRQGSHICGASLISGTRAVSAAHCIGSPANFYQILAGSTDRTNTASGQLRTLNLAVRHPSYGSGPGSYPNDIAVLGFDFLAEAFPNIAYINLATPADGDFAGSQAVISGWGVVSDGSLPTTLQRGQITILSNDACKAIWGPGSINDGHICISAPTTGACNGDSGGPLVANGLLAGATSWGSFGCNPSFPSVYSRVSYFVDWIRAQ